MTTQMWTGEDSRLIMWIEYLPSLGVEIAYGPNFFAMYTKDTVRKTSTRDLPAFVRRLMVKNVKTTNRCQTPTPTSRDEMESLIRIDWLDNGTRHREDGPGVIFLTESGDVLSENYYQHNQAHRVGGPAIVEYDTGKERFFLKGVEYDPLVYWAKVKSEYKTDK